MYLRGGFSGARHLGGSANSYFGEPLPSKDVCPNYEKGEVELSRCQTGACQQGHLVNDVIKHPRGLLIADFGVNWSGIKAATKKEKLLHDWMSEIKSDLHSVLLRIYGYTDCVDEKKDSVGLRTRRALAVFNLLDKDLQSRVAYKGAAKPLEYVADNKTKEGRANNRGVIIEVSRFKERPIIMEGKLPPPPPQPCTKPPCPPVPQPQPVQQRNWKVVGKYIWKAKKRRLLKKGYFEIFAELVVKGTVSINATDSEFATFALKWEKGKGPGGEFQTKMNDWFVPDLKVERDKEKWTISFKKEIETLGGKVTFKPHLQLSTEIVKTEVVILPFEIPTTLFGQKVTVKVEPTINIIIKVDLWEVLLDRLKKKLKDWLGDLFKDLLARLGAGILGALAKKVLAALLGGVLAELLLSDSPTQPVTAPADDVSGKDAALKQAGGTSTAAEILQRWANTHRHAFAKAYADTMLQLSSEQWRERMAQLRTRTIKGYKALPAPNAPEKEWQVWTSTRKALELISIDLPTDNYAKRFRWYEVALMLAVAAWILRRMTKKELDDVKGIVLQQASVAGMAAAVQYVNRRIEAETFEFIDERGKTQFSNGIKRWEIVGKLVRKSELSDAEISKRLERLGVKQLPPRPKVA